MQPKITQKTKYKTSKKIDLLHISYKKLLFFSFFLNITEILFISNNY
ncbi:hypothetical protein RCH33_2829 [Flavobacterium daejeonense]|nr:hypothetical protein RCH33_2829 [Flavobacterium daejeonense]